MVEATSPSFKWGSIPQLVRHPSKESEAEETGKKGRMITEKDSLPLDYLKKKIKFLQTPWRHIQPLGYVDQNLELLQPDEPDH